MLLSEALLVCVSLAALAAAGAAFARAKLYREEDARDAVAEARRPSCARVRAQCARAFFRALTTRVRVHALTPPAQCLFCVTFALSLFLLALILFDMTGALSHRRARARGALVAAQHTLRTRRKTPHTRSTPRTSLRTTPSLTRTPPRPRAPALLPSSRAPARCACAGAAAWAGCLRALWWRRPFTFFTPPSLRAVRAG
jgi:hypothetical protein